MSLESVNIDEKIIYCEEKTVVKGEKDLYKKSKDDILR